MSLKRLEGLGLALGVLWTASFLGCGVRGRPQPPLTPAELGRGQPTFSRGSEEFAFPNVPSPEATPETRRGSNKKSAPPSGDAN